MGPRQTETKARRWRSHGDRNEERRHQHHQGEGMRGARGGLPGGVVPPSRSRHPQSSARGGIVDLLAGGASPGGGGVASPSPDLVGGAPAPALQDPPN